MHERPIISPIFITDSNIFYKGNLIQNAQKIGTNNGVEYHFQLPERETDKYQTASNNGLSLGDTAGRAVHIRGDRTPDTNSVPSEQ
jgi:hypothetical protein